MERIATLMNPGDFAGKGDVVHTDLKGVAREITENGELKRRTSRMAELLAAGKTGEAKAYKQKKLPIAQLHSVCDGERKGNNVRDVTGWLVLDIDDYDGDYNELKYELWADPVLNPCMVFRSPSGKLKAVLQCKSLEKDLFKETYGSAMLWFFDNYGIKPDKACNDIARNCFLSHDSRALLDESRYTSDEVLAIHDPARYRRVFGASVVSSHRGSGFTDEAKSVVEEILKTVERDSEGYPLWEIRKRQFIGHQGDRTDVKYGKLYGFEYSGNPLMLRINAAAMALFNQNAEKAQEFIDACYTDAGDRWSRCESHADYAVSTKVLQWMITSHFIRKKTTITWKNHTKTTNLTTEK